MNEGLNEYESQIVEQICNIVIPILEKVAKHLAHQLDETSIEQTYFSNSVFYSVIVQYFLNAYWSQSPPVSMQLAFMAGINKCMASCVEQIAGES